MSRPLAPPRNQSPAGLSQAARWCGGVALVLLVGIATWVVAERIRPPVDDVRPSSSEALPPPGGWFTTRPAGSWRDLPSDARCADEVRHSPWEPRPDNYLPNHTMPSERAVRAALRSRPRAVQGAYDPRWDSWLLRRVTGHHVGTTDENIQWAACKWGVSDDVLRAVAVRESNWHQYAVYPNGECVLLNGCGDVLEPTPATKVFCEMQARWGRDYQRDYGRGRCPRTFSMIGVSAWQDPEWSHMEGSQNGTFPFARNSTAFALDYYGGFLRGCLEGWESWLGHSGQPYHAGDLWGCVGAWYAGAWHTANADAYVTKVKSTLADRPWRSAQWSALQLPCDHDLGCPQGARRTELPSHPGPTVSR